MGQQCQEALQRLEARIKGMTTAVGEVFSRFLSTFDQDCDTADLDEPTQKALQALLRTCLEEVKDYVKTELDPAWEALVKSHH